MAGLERVSWLFVRGTETIRVNYSAGSLSITASGPGHDRHVYRFGDEPTAAEFLKLYEQFLGGGGWLLQAFVERRSDQRAELPDGRERRKR